MITFKEYQKRSRETAIYPDLGDNIVYPMLGLVGETGEIAEKVKKFIHGDTAADNPMIGLEIGDVLWYLAQLCTELNLDLELIAEGNLRKLKDRAKRGALRGDGDTR